MSHSAAHSPNASHCWFQNSHTCSCSHSHTQRQGTGCECTHPRIHVCAVTLTPIVEAVIVVVVLMVVLQGRGAAGSQLCQSATGGREFRAEVGHFLTGRLDSPINSLCQLFVVFHHFKDFPLRTKSTQSSMVSRGALQGGKQTPFPPPPPPLIPLLFLLHLYFFSQGLLCTYKKQKTQVPLPFWAEQFRDEDYLLLHKEITPVWPSTTQWEKACVWAGQRRKRVSSG